MDRYTFINYQSETTNSNKYRAYLVFKNTDFYIGLSKTTPWFDIEDELIDDNNPPIPNKDINVLPELVILKRIKDVYLAKESVCGDSLIMDRLWSLYKEEDISWENGKIIPDITHILYRVLLRPEDFLASNIRTLSLHSHPIFTQQSVYEYDVAPSSLIQDQGLIHWVSNSTPLIREDLTNIYSEINILLEI